MLAGTPITVALPPSALTVRASSTDPATVPDLRLKVLPHAVLCDAPSPSPQPDSRALANALKVLAPRARDIRVKLTLDMRNLDDSLSLSLRHEALQTLTECLTDVRRCLGLNF